MHATEEVKWRLFFVGMGSLPTEGLLLGFRSFEVPPAAPLSEFWACSRALYSRATPRSHTQVSFLHCTRRTFPAIVTEMEEFRRANRYKTFFHWNSITSLFSFSFKKDFFHGVVGIHFDSDVQHNGLLSTAKGQLNECLFSNAMTYAFFYPKAICSFRPLTCTYVYLNLKNMKVGACKKTV